MTLTAWGALLGGLVGAGVLLVGARAHALRRADLAPGAALPPRPSAPGPTGAAAAETSAARGVFGPLLRGAAEGVERVLGGAASVRRRLERAGIDQSVHEFRVRQVLWGVVAFAGAAGVAVLKTLAARAGRWRWCCSAWPPSPPGSWSATTG